MANIVNKMSVDMGNAIVAANMMNEKAVTEMEEFLSSVALGAFIDLATYVPDKYRDMTLIDLINSEDIMANEIIKVTIQAADEAGFFEDE